ncbi:MAG TPA: hypothetical protein VGQ09_11825 [Chitinophagaceae bacterium]|jgi:hypothetical protein|nr:hypothetical protein [Chitinophagaceae bacterium]
MKPKMYALLLGTIALLTFNTASAFTTLIVITKPAATTTIKDPNPLSLITAQQFLTLTPQKFQELTGKKLNLIQKVQLKMVQHKVKKMLKRGEVVTMADVQKKFDDVGTMNVLGFLLGLILGPVGVIIALILKETGDVGSDVVRWSLYGLLVWLAIVLIAILI